MEKFLKIPLRQRVLVLLIALGLIFIVFYFVVFSDIDTRKAQLITANRNLRNDFAQLKAKRDRGDTRKLARELKDLRRKLQELNEILPKGETIDTFLANFEADAKTAQLRIESLNRREPEHLASFARLPVNTRMTGTYIAFIQFFRRLSDRSSRQGQKKRIVNVTSIKLRIKGTEKIGGKSMRILNGDFTANTYMLSSGKKLRKK